MNVHSYSKNLHKLLELYEAKLAGIPESDFQQTPGPNQWSYAEVYAHLIASNGLTLRGLEKCIDGTAKIMARPAHWKARLILFLGRLPGQQKIPAVLESTVKKISKKEALEGMQRCRELLGKFMERIDRVDKSRGLKHPRMGYLNTVQWIRFMQVHTRHHLAQLSRIEAMLPKKAS